jgi:hypothetical protein
MNEKAHHEMCYFFTATRSNEDQETYKSGFWLGWPHDTRQEARNHLQWA